MPPARSLQPKTILVLNSGSSSLKFACWRGSVLLLRGSLDRIGAAGTYTLQRRSKTISRHVRADNLRQSLLMVIRSLDAEHITPEIVAHRLVHGGGVFHGPTRLTAAVLERVASFTDLAPLHLPANLLGVAIAKRHWPKAEQWGVFDTSIYDRLPPAVRTYAIPEYLAKKYRIRKYGFHGISHAWAWHQAGRKLQRPLRSLSGVSLHLGAGDSVTLWRHGQAIDTSMGFTPLEGLAMATRSGDIDPMIPLYLQEHAGYTAGQVEDILQRRSGLFGLTGLRDVRDVLSAAGQPIPGWPRRHWTETERHHAQLAVAMFLHDIQRYLASYLGLLKHPDLIVFTGAIGQNPWIRRQVLAGVPITKGLRVVWIPTDEEQAIAEAVRPMVN